MTLLSTIRSSLLGRDEHEKEDKTELLALSANEARASTILEKPRRGLLPREISKTFRFSRQDSPAILVSDFERGGAHSRTDWDSSRLDVEYTHDADTEYPVISSSQQKNLQRTFVRSKQLRRLLLRGFIGWVFTCFLVGMIYYSLIHFSEKHVISDGKKRLFNSVITALSLALGFNMAASFKAMAVDLRWWILSRRKRSLREVDLILNCDSMMNVFKLMFIAPRPRVILVCLSWLVLNLGTQTAVAMLGLTYSIDNGDNYALTAYGQVSSPDMTFFYPENHRQSSNMNPSPSSQNYTANIYGNAALSYKHLDISQIKLPGMTWNSDTADYFEGDDFWEYAFLDSSPATGSSAISMYTNRTIIVNSTCSCSPITGLSQGTAPYLNMTAYTIGSLCGTRCSTVTAVELVSIDEAWRYTCNTTIGIPSNTNTSSHQYVPDAMAITAAGSIALQSYGQQQMYPAETTYGTPQKGNTTSMAKLISRFAIGSIIGAAYNNPTSTLLGNQPQEGVVLSIDKRFFMVLILLLTAGTQGVLFILSALLANRVVVRDDTHLATARLLRPLMERLGRSGSMANGKDMSEALGADVPGSRGRHLKVIYSVKHAREGYLHHLDLGEQDALRRAFPEGEYE